jgi:sulfur relay (sulfurtransferase) complex TusBCD TusD component (DsrE family)
MKRSIWLATLGAVVAAATLAQPALADNTQQTKMTTCNADAKTKGLTGDDRKTYMKTCLSAGSTTDSKPLNSQQVKMKSCNADAKTKGLTGDERKTFMSSCLKGPASP